MTRYPVVLRDDDNMGARVILMDDDCIAAGVALGRDKNDMMSSIVDDR